MLKKRVENIVSGATDAVTGAVTGALEARAHSASVRLDDDSMQRIDQLVEAEMVADRAAGIAFLVQEGIRARTDLFEQINDSFAKIRQVKDHLRSLGPDSSPGEEVDASD